jgi:hypothetical protein
VLCVISVRLCFYIWQFFCTQSNSTYLSNYRLYYTNSIPVSYLTTFCSLYVMQACWSVHYELGTKLQPIFISSWVQNLSDFNATLVSTEKPNKSMTSIHALICLRFNSFRKHSPPWAQWHEGCPQAINQMLSFILCTFQTGQWASVGKIELFSPHEV